MITFDNKILFVGFGFVARCTLPILLRHIKIDPKRITIIDFAPDNDALRPWTEQGVRFVQLFDWGWDVHGTNPGDDLMTQLPKKCQQVDQPISALLTDLERRGLLKETLVIWGGEFGRTAMNEARNGSKLLGRDHHPDCFSIWMAGGGIKPGTRYGETDDFGYTITQDPVGVRDLQATILHLLGKDPHQFSFPFQGLDQRLIGPANDPRVIQGLLA